MGSIYIKESDGATFTYRVLDAKNTTNDFLTQLNAQGAEGFLYIGPSFGDMYAKSSIGNTKYDYRVIATPASNADRLTQANAQGQEGYKFSGPSGFGDLYVRDSSQSSKFEWKANPEVRTQSELLTQANAEGTAGYVYWFSIGSSLGQSDAKEFYFKPNACTGPLCRSTSPL